MSTYDLVCTGCSTVYDDDGVRLQCTSDHPPALLRTRYADQMFRPGSERSMLRYRNWLPDAREVPTAARIAVYRSTALAAHLGLQELWIAFSGWWPQRGAALPTGTFKDLEAVSVTRRIAAGDTRPLVVSSAGNTACAFARVCTDNAIAAIIIVPLCAVETLRRAVPIGPTVQLVAIADAGYEEAIGLARELCVHEEFLLEGGVRNVARRDGMGTVMLAAVETIGRLPDSYFQAVGSAAGALAAHEAALRIIADGRFGTRLPRLMLAQNTPFAPIHDAWRSGHVALLARSLHATQSDLAQLGAFVLGNQAPPYAPAGGVYAALAASRGATFAVSNEQLGNAMSLFAELEGIDIEPASGVAVAALARAVAGCDVDRAETVLLHVTGGGRRALGRDASGAEPALVLARGELTTTAIDRTRSLLRSH